MDQNLNSDEKKIFVVDDDLAIGDVVSNLLMLEGYNVHTFSAGHDAIESAQDKKADLVLLDYFLPGERAEDIISELRDAMGEELPIVLMSANAKGEQIARQLPVSEFMAKPFQIDQLLETVKRNID